MWSKILTIVPRVLGFLAKQSESHPKTALGSAGGFAGLIGFLGSPEFQAAVRNGLADIFTAAAEVLRQTPPITG